MDQGTSALRLCLPLVLTYWVSPDLGSCSVGRYSFKQIRIMTVLHVKGSQTNAGRTSAVYLISIIRRSLIEHSRSSLMVTTLINILKEVGGGRAKNGPILYSSI